METVFSKGGERMDSGTEQTQTKAITFKLQPITKVKQERLKALADNFKTIYNHAATYMPSLQDIRQSKSRNVLNQWRKDLKNEITVHSKIAEEAFEYARANYQTIITTNQSINPELKKPIIRFHNQVWEFKQKNNTTYLIIPTERKGNGNRYEYMALPLKESEYYNDIISCQSKFGVGQLNLTDQTFTTTFTTKNNGDTTLNLNYKPETYIGIDLGTNNLAVMVVTDKTKKILKTKFWNGNETQYIRNKFYKYRSQVQKIKRLDKIEESKGYESNWMKNVNHNISKQMIEIAMQYPNPIILLENLHKFNKKIRWNFYQLRQMICYKAMYHGIITDLIPPAYTSNTCNKCGHSDKNNRKELTFKCLNCGYESHADFNAAINIAHYNLK
jgi:IS605 OrfB family transposase